MRACKYAHTHTCKKAQFRKSIWDQETNYLNYFPFSLLHCLLLVSLPSILVAFAFVGISGSRISQHAITPKLTEGKNKKEWGRLGSVFICWDIKPTVLFLSPNMKRECFALPPSSPPPPPNLHPTQYSGWGIMTRPQGSYYILLDRPNGAAVKPSGPVCSAAASQQFSLTETPIAQLCVTAHLLRGDSVSMTTFAEKEVIIMW